MQAVHSVVWGSQWCSVVEKDGGLGHNRGGISVRLVRFVAFPLGVLPDFGLWL